MSGDKKTVPIRGDNPISDPKDDVLDRTEVAKSFARQVLSLDTSKGFAVGVFGPWGSGKTSFINLARTEFAHRNIPVLDFNPWMFSGTEQLVERFFTELSAELKLRNLAKVGKAFEDYGEAFNGGAGVMVKLLGRFLRRRHGGIASHRSKVEQVLRERDKPIIAAFDDVEGWRYVRSLLPQGPIVTVLDDIDRLTVSEIRDVFKLVRLTASFSNLIYIVACDRLQVEKALDEKKKGLSGRIYLEKSFSYPSICRKSRTIYSGNSFTTRSITPLSTSETQGRSMTKLGVISTRKSSNRLSRICETFAATPQPSREPWLA